MQSAMMQRTGVCNVNTLGLGENRGEGREVNPRSDRAAGLGLGLSSSSELPETEGKRRAARRSGEEAPAAGNATMGGEEERGASGDSKWSAVFAHTIVTERPRSWK